MTRKIIAAWLAFALTGPQAALGPLWAAEGPKSGARASLDSIEVGADQVTLTFSAAPKFNTFVTNNPPRLVLEMYNTEFALSTKNIDGKGKYLKKVRSGQFAGEPNPIARIVMDLSQAVAYRVVADGSTLTVRLEPAPAGADKAVAAPAAKAPAPADNTGRGASSAGGDKDNAVAAGKPAGTAGADTDKGKTDLKTAAAEKPEAPAVKVGRKAPAEKGPADETLPESMTTQNSEEVSNMAGQSSAMPKSEASADAPAPAPRAGRPFPRLKRDILATLPRNLITLDLDNTDIAAALKMMASKADVNLITGSDVSGSMNLHLTNVPFTEAFNIILSMNKLVASQIGENVLRVSTPGTLQAERTNAIGITRVYPINYITADDAKSQIDAVRTAEGRRGTTTVDKANNAVIVTETPEGLAAVERLLSMIDTRPRQVLIEAKLVEVKLSKELDLGIQWDYNGQFPSGNDGGQRAVNAVGTAANPLKNTSPAPIRGLSPFDSTAAQSVGAAGRGTGVLLPADKVFGAFTFGRITNNYFLTATLTAAATQGKVKVLSDPKIATINGKLATINITTQTPFVTTNVASTGVATQSVSFVTTGIKLDVTPTINADGRIMLIVHPNVSQPSATAAANAATGAIGTDAREAITNVMVKDGETIVIGGLITDSVQNTEAKVPLLGDIPILGWLFKKKTVIRSRVELLIFVTTKVMVD